MNTGDPAASRVASTAVAPILPGILFHPILQVGFSQPSRSSGCSAVQDSQMRAALRCGISSCSLQVERTVGAVVMGTIVVVFFQERRTLLRLARLLQRRNRSQAMMLLVGRAGVFSALASSCRSVYGQYSWSTSSHGNLRGGGAHAAPLCEPFVTHHCQFRSRWGLRVSRSHSLCYQGTRKGPASMLGNNEGAC